MRKKTIAKGHGEPPASKNGSKMSVSERESLARTDATVADVQAYWNKRPCNIYHSDQAVGTIKYFDEVEARKYFVEPHITSFADFPRWRGKKVLEVGCGIGTDAVNFVRAGAIYTGIDISETTIDIARKRLEIFDLSARLIACNGEQMTAWVPTSSYDLVYSFGVIHHSLNQRAIVEEIRKVVRPSGEFRCMLYARNSWKDVMIEAGFDQPEAQSGCPIATTYTRQMLDTLFEGLFELKEVKQAHIFPYVVEKYVDYEYELQPWFKVMPPGMLDALERRFGWHLLITATPLSL